MSHLQDIHDDCFQRRVAWNRPEVFTLDWWRESTPFRLFAQYASRRGTELLDIGCFTGELSILYEQYGYRVTAIEVSQAAYNFALTQNLKFGGTVSFTHGVFEDFPIVSTFSTVILSHVLEHIPDPGPVITKAWAACDDVMILIVPKGYTYDDPTHVHHWQNLIWIESYLPSAHIQYGTINNAELYAIVTRMPIDNPDTV